MRRFFEEVVFGRRLEVLDELLASEFVAHSSVLGDVHGGAAYSRSIAALLNGSSDLNGSIDDLLSAENDTVVARMTYRGTDSGGLVPGRPASNKAYEFTATYIWRVVDGKLSEMWQEADRARLLQQLQL